MRTLSHADSPVKPANSPTETPPADRLEHALGAAARHQLEQADALVAAIAASGGSIELTRARYQHLALAYGLDRGAVAELARFLAARGRIEIPPPEAGGARTAAVVLRLTGEEATS